ncbi:hypothetical protein HZA86_03670 [Candidatus Uhrbacteria bacterium]|nr:hypothetical protein [Candidatus Uhrbacteria bacterium]
MIFTMIAIVVAWSLLDWVLYGSSWVQRAVYARMDSAIWTPPRPGESTSGAQRRTMMTSVIITIFSGIMFSIFGEWSGLAGLSWKTALAVAGLLWAVFVVPTAVSDRLYFRVGTRYTMLQLFAGAFKIAAACVIFALRQ